MNIKAILIDLDGTITDTERIYQRQWVEAARQLGYDAFTREDALMLRSAWYPYAVKLMQIRFGDSLDFDKLKSLCADNTLKELKETGTPIKPYAEEFLKELKSRGKKIVLVSATRPDVIDSRLKAVGLTDYFDEVISAHGTKRGKPYPEPYLYACEVIGVKPEETIAIEDSPNGVDSATAAGCNTIMVPDLTEATDEMRAKLYGYAGNLMEVLDYIN